MSLSYFIRPSPRLNGTFDYRPIRKVKETTPFRIEKDIDPFLLLNRMTDVLWISGFPDQEPLDHESTRRPLRTDDQSY